MLFFGLLKQLLFFSFCLNSNYCFKNSKNLLRNRQSCSNKFSQSFFFFKKVESDYCKDTKHGKLDLSRHVKIESLNLNSFKKCVSTANKISTVSKTKSLQVFALKSQFVSIFDLVLTWILDLDNFKVSLDS